MAKIKNLTQEEREAKYNEEMAKIQVKHDKRLVYLAAKRERLTAKLNKKFADNPEKLEQEIGIMHIDNDVWVDIANAQLAERAKTLELKYLKENS